MRKVPLLTGTLLTHASEAFFAEGHCAAMEVGERRQLFGFGTAGTQSTQSISSDAYGSES